MKKQFSGFLSGLLTAAVLYALCTAALAASGAVEFNTVGLRYNGTQVATAGENFTLDNGQQVPATIIYTDESGGGTTYLPIRRIAELLGTEVGWDAPSGSVTIGAEAAPAPAAPAPEVTEPVTVTVYVTATGTKYHAAGCRYLSQSQISLSLNQARGQGYTPCSVCHPPR